jgi:hypothetical protein
VSHLDKGSADENGVSGIKEECSNFGFGSRRGNSTQRFAENMNSAVRRGSGRSAGGRLESGQEEVASSTAALIGQDQVGCVRTDGIDHVRSMVTNGGVGMMVGGHGIKKHVSGNTNFLEGEAC